MKKLLTIMILVITLVGCKKNTTEPEPAPAPPPSTNNVNTNPTNLTQQEQDLAGYWIMDSIVHWNLTMRMYSVVYTNTVTCMLNLTTGWLMNNSSFALRSAMDGHNSCVASEVGWKAPNQGSFHLSSVLYAINVLTSTKLQFDYGPPNGLTKYYFHK